MDFGRGTAKKWKLAIAEEAKFGKNGDASKLVGGSTIYTAAAQTPTARIYPFKCRVRVNSSRCFCGPFCDHV